MLKKMLFAIAILIATAMLYIGYRLVKSWNQPRLISDKERAAYMAKPHMRLANYNFIPASQLETRLKPAPDFLLDFLRRYDNTTAYATAMPTPEQRRIFAKLVSQLPAGVRKHLQTRLLGVYLVSNFLGNGLATPLYDGGPDSPNYVWLVLNSAAFDRTLEETLSSRESSAFMAGSGISVKCHRKISGAAYAFSHEIGHALDYISGITPYVSPDYAQMKLQKPADALRMPWERWSNYSKLPDVADSPLRKKIKFYGLDGGPILRAEDAEELYAWLNDSPFVSLYASQNWAEDIAEKFSYAYLTRLQGGKPCEVIYPGGRFAPGKVAQAESEALYTRFDH